MKLLLTIIAIGFITLSKGQAIDSTWLAEQILPRFYKDTGTYLPDAKFVDVNNKTKTLQEYKGQILYVNIWSTSCGSSLAKFPYLEQLLKRLKTIHLDTLVTFININIDDTKKEWQNALEKYHPVGINLYCSDTAISSKWNFEPIPAFILLDSSGKVLGKGIYEPDEGGVDYMIYAATKCIHPVQALWMQYEQSKLMAQYKTSAAITDEDYKKWFNLTIKSFIEFQKWRQQHQQSQNNR